jgi:hypothetical protein
LTLSNLPTFDTQITLQSGVVLPQTVEDIIELLNNYLNLCISSLNINSITKNMEWKW